MHRLPSCRPPHRLSICKSFLFRVSLTTREFKYQSHSASSPSRSQGSSTSQSGVASQESKDPSQVVSKGVASKRSAVRRPILHFVHQIALEPLLRLIKTKRINCHEGLPRSHSALPSSHHPCPSRARKTVHIAELFTPPSSHHDSLSRFKSLL